MDAQKAMLMAEDLEMRIGVHADADAARVECYAVPLRPTSARRGSKWALLIVTDVEEPDVREAANCYQLEYVERRGQLHVMMAWPRTRV